MEKPNNPIVITEAQWMVLLDALQGSLQVADRIDGSGVWKYAWDTRVQVFEHIWAQLNKRTMELQTQ